MQQYIEEVKIDIEFLLKNEMQYGELWKDLDIYELREWINNPRYSNSVTGNANGSYYCSTYKAMQQLNKTGVIFDEDFLTWTIDKAVDLNVEIRRGPEIVDSLARICAVDLLPDEELMKIYKEAHE